MKKLVLLLTFACLLFAFDKVQAQTSAGDAITNMTVTSSTVTQGEFAFVTVEYTAATADRDLNVSIKSISTNATYGFNKATVTQGSGTKIVNLAIYNNIPLAANDYKIVCYMTTVGGSWDPNMPQIQLDNISAVAGVYYDINVNNGDIEDVTPMSQDAVTTNRWNLKGIFLMENTANTFDAANSGLALGEGRNGSQALKSIVQNAINSTSSVTVSIGDADISSHGPGTYKYSFYVKSSILPSKRPFWILVSALDENGATLSGTLTPIDNGGTVTWSGMNQGYVKQSISVYITGNTTKYLRLQVQHGVLNNTYWFDDFTLVGPKAVSTSIGNKPVELGINVFPNPASSYTTITSETIIKNISLHDISGKLTTDVKVNSQEYQLDLSSYPKGIYVLSVINGKGTTSSKLVVK